jgi:DNA-binding NtrC family response regulator
MMVKKSTALTVLVVDDELLIRWAIAQTLTSAGHTIAEAETGTAALRLLADPSRTFDAVLLDFRLPDSDDLQLLARIRHMNPRRPVILMTAYGTAEMTDGARALGVYDVINKPFAMEDLHELLRQACDLM